MTAMHVEHVSPSPNLRAHLALKYLYIHKKLRSLNSLVATLDA